MKDTYQKIYQGFCDSTKKTFYVNAVAILLIFIFMMTPTESSSRFTNVIARMAIISLLSYSLYINIVSSKSLWDIESIFVNSNLAIVRNNFILNSVFSLSILAFIVFLVDGFFR